MCSQQLKPMNEWMNDKRMNLRMALQTNETLKI